jgi:hypothetical protein
MRVSVLMIAVGLMAPGIAVHAQTMRDGSVYKVDFNIRDSGDAGAKSGRKYSMVLNSGIKGVFKVGNRVPTATGASGGALVNTQFTYIDVGMNVEAVVAEQGAKIAMHASLDISTAVPAAKDSAVQNPTISQIRVDMDTSVLPGKPSVVASFDDPVTGRKFDVEVTIIKM